MFKEYIEDRAGGLLVTPEGFVVYTQPSTNYLLIHHIYVIPEWEKTCVASHMINQVAEIARDKGCEYIEGFIEQEYKHQQAYLLFDDFRIIDEDKRWVYFRKNL